MTIATRTMVLGAAALAALLGAAPGGWLYAAGGYDGTWVGVAKVEGADVGKGDGPSACVESPVEVQVIGDAAQGSAFIDGSYYLVTGKIKQGGAFLGNFSEEELTGKFAGDVFSGLVASAHADCKRTLTLKRR
jgi:hypothetical protein